MNALDLGRCSINTATLGHLQPIAATIETVARHGFGGITPWRRDVEEEDVRAVARHIRDAGLEISGYCRSAYIPGIDRKTFAANIDRRS